MHKCEYCGKSFSREKTLFNHTCLKKSRWLNKNTKEGKLAFLIWQRFHEISMRGKTTTYEKFVDSNLYGAFHKFAIYIIDLDIQNPKEFIDWVIKNQIPVDKWATDKTYDLYLKDVLRKETPDSGLERSMKLMQKWANDKNENWYNFFEKVNTNQALIWILSGKISPWIFILSERSNLLLERMNEEQLNLVNNIVDPITWKKKEKRWQKEITKIKKILQEENL